MNIKKDLDKIDDKKVLLGIKRSIDGHLKLPFFKTNSYISKIIDVIFNHKFNIDRINTITRDIINRIQLIDAYVEDIDAKFNEFDNKNDARNEAFKSSILNKMLENQTLSEASFKLENNNLLNKIENLNEIIDHLDHKYLKLLTSIRDENFEQNRKNALLISTLNEKIEEFKNILYQKATDTENKLNDLAIKSDNIANNNEILSSNSLNTLTLINKINLELFKINSEIDNIKSLPNSNFNFLNTNIKFVQKTNKPKKILFIGNLAHNGYLTARLFNEMGHDCDVVNYDYYHIGARPEWYEIDLPNEYANDMDAAFPNFWKFGMGDLPYNWLFNGPLLHCIQTCNAARDKNSRFVKFSRRSLEYFRFKIAAENDYAAITRPWSRDQFNAAVFKLGLTQEARLKLKPFILHDILLHKFRELWAEVSGNKEVAMSMNTPLLGGFIDAVLGKDLVFDRLIRRLRRLGLSGAIGFEATHLLTEALDDLEDQDVKDNLYSKNYNLYSPYWKALFKRYDLIIGCAHDAILPLKVGFHPYIAFDIGTVRGLSSSNKDVDKLIALAFQKADIAYITNTDFVTDPEPLALDSQKTVFGLHAFDKRILSSFKEKNQEYVLKSNPITFFCPARLDWVDRDNRLGKGNDLILRAAKSLKDKSFINFHIRMVAWGRDTEATKALVVELGIEDLVTWVPVLSKPGLYREYLNANATIDQFFITGLSGIAFETLALGRRIITREDGIANKTFFGETPPILAAHDLNSLIAAMTRILNDPLDKSQIGLAGEQWCENYHSIFSCAEAFESLIQKVTKENV